MGYGPLITTFGQLSKGSAVLIITPTRFLALAIEPVSLERNIPMCFTIRLKFVKDWLTFCLVQWS